MNPRSFPGFRTARAASGGLTSCSFGPFLEIEQALRQPGVDTPLMRRLKVADKLVFKVWMISRSLQLAGGIALVTLLVMLAALGWLYWSRTAFSMTVGALLTAFVCLALGAAGWGPLVKTIQYRKTFQSILIGFGMGTLGFLLARLHLHVFDRLFLWYGRLKRLMPKSKAKPGKGELTHAGGIVFKDNGNDRVFASVRFGGKSSNAVPGDGFQSLISKFSMPNDTAHLAIGSARKY
jgi:hypothetical protein